MVPDRARSGAELYLGDGIERRGDCSNLKGRAAAGAVTVRRTDAREHAHRVRRQRTPGHYADSGADAELRSQARGSISHHRHSRSLDPGTVGTVHPGLV